MNFPTIVYRTPGAHHASSGSYDYKGAADEADLDRALSSGWFRTLPEAMAGDHEELPDNSAPTREEMEAKAAELGIKFDGRTTDKSMAEKIETALDKGE
jgi:hypothetical protein